MAATTTRWAATARGLDDGGFLSFGHFCKSLAVERSSARAASALEGWRSSIAYKAPSGMFEGSGADGGDLVPAQFVDRIYQRMKANSILEYLDPIAATTRTVTIPVLKEDSRADASRHGGMLGYWHGGSEAVQYTGTRPIFRTVNLQLKKLTVSTYATAELLEDAATLDRFLTDLAARELNYQINDMVINGPGGSRPLGILNSGSKITVTAVTGQGANTIVSQNITDMAARCLEPFIWLCNKQTMAQVLRMFLASGHASNDALLQPGPDGTWLLHNAPVVVVEQCAALGTEGDLICFSPSRYACAVQGGIQTFMSIHLRFDYDEHLYKFRIRFDGQPYDDVALTPAHGSDTLSGIVTLSSTRT